MSELQVISKSNDLILEKVFSDDAGDVQNSMMTFFKGDQEKYIKEVTYLSEMYIKNKLNEADPRTLKRAFMFLIGNGYSLDPIAKHCTIKTRNMKIGNNYVKVAEPTVMYKGKENYLKKNNIIQSLHRNVVYKDDLFKLELGTKNTILHEPNIEVEREDKNVTGAYAVVKLPNGETQIFYLTKKEIDKRKAKAQSKNVWNGWYPEMCKKTIVNKAFDELAIEASDEAFNYEYIEDQNIEIDATKPRRKL